MDEAVLYSKIESLKRCLDRIKSKTPDSVEVLKSDWDRQDIIILNLERAVQICVDIASLIIAELDVKTPTKMADCFRELSLNKVIKEETAERMRRSVGFRNIAVHEYSRINWDIVYSIVNNHLEYFKAFARETIQWNTDTQD
ncbi:MAG: DUF86 domain-containing protein [Proteobacteria bacterium]|nr:DUF86 domain-containing protein [Pseudomonadota bacterium]